MTTEQSDDNNITGWRTVSIHGQPPHGVPVLVKMIEGTVLSTAAYHLNYADHIRWIPVSELDKISDAPPPPRTVTIEVSEKDARYLSMRWFTSLMTTNHEDDKAAWEREAEYAIEFPEGRIALALQSALAELDGETS